MKKLLLSASLSASLSALVAMAPATALGSNNIPDKYPGSVLYDEPVQVIPNVWSAIGATAPPSKENAGHNNNLSFIVTGAGVVVINGGACYKLAQALHEEIKKITDQPVVQVINENGQGHAMLGNTYWKEQGVPILAHEDAAEDFNEKGAQILQRMRQYNGEELAAGTEITLPTETFSDEKILDIGNFHIEVKHLGPAHSPGDISVWLPEQGLVIAGDMAFHERLPPIFDDTITSEWVDTWENEFEPLNATYVIPGHGHPTNMAEVRRYTRDYLVYLRGKVQEVLDNGGSLEDAYYVDQSPYAHLDTFEELATKNAGRVYVQMEFE